ncbi:MAG: class I SAM-dependent methyltransferase [Thaumarchaeota archaeon]|nr:class I SAM-dependent methyltransferase [Nitrososphaerota archaeon]
MNLVFNFSYDGYTIAPLQVIEEIKLLLEILYELKPKTILEIGTAAGGTLFLLCKTADPKATIISVDLPEGKFGGELYPDWKNDFYKSFRTKEQNLHLIRSDSHSADTFKNIVKILETKKIDFILIDGDHTLEGVEKDFEMYSRLVSDEGFIAFHDINPGPKENVGEVPEFWKKMKSQHETLEIIDDKLGGTPGLGLLFIHFSKDRLRYITIIKKLLKFKESQLDICRTKLNKIRANKGYKIIRFCRSKIYKLLRNRSVRTLKENILVSVKVIKTEGMGSFLMHAQGKIKRREFKIKSPQSYYVSSNKVQDEQKSILAEHLFSEGPKQVNFYNQKFNVGVVIPKKDEQTSFRIKMSTQKGINLNISSTSSESNDLILFMNKHYMPLTDHMIYDCCKIFQDNPEIGIVSVREIPSVNSDIAYSYFLKKKYGSFTSDRIVLEKNNNQLSDQEKDILTSITESCFLYNNKIFSKYKLDKNQDTPYPDILMTILNKGYKIVQLNFTGVIYSKERTTLHYLKHGYDFAINTSSAYKKIDFETLKISSFVDLSSHILGLYTSLCNAIDVLDQNEADYDISTTFYLVTSNLLKFSKNKNKKKYKSSDKILDDLFTKFTKTNYKAEQESYLLQQYVDSLKDFEYFIKETYPNLKNIRKKLIDSFYKIFAEISGRNIGAFAFYFKTKRTSDEDLTNFKKLLDDSL